MEIFALAFVQANEYEGLPMRRRKEAARIGAKLHDKLT